MRNKKDKFDSANKVQSKIDTFDKEISQIVKKQSRLEKVMLPVYQLQTTTIEDMHKKQIMTEIMDQHIQTDQEIAKVQNDIKLMQKESNEISDLVK